MNEPTPQPLDDAIWDAIMSLAKLKIRMQRNGHAEHWKRETAYLDVVITEMGKWMP
jgi:hypothetical protein